MTLCRFADVGFDIEGNDDPFFALLGLGMEGPPTITLQILLYSRSDARSLYNYRTKVTVRTSIQTFTGRAVIHAGKGARKLRLPTGNNHAIEAYSAILQELVLERHEFDGTLYRGQATFLILSDPTP